MSKIPTNDTRPRYILIKSSGLQALTEAVNGAMKLGYKCQGGPTYIPGSGSVQAMVLDTV